MSIMKEIAITCPECQKNSKFTIWESINTVLDPDMKAAVRNRSAFLFTCPNCGTKKYVDYGFLYHQMEDHIMIHYVNSDENEEEIYNLITMQNMPGNLQKMMGDLQDHDYLIRIVRSQAHLIEKLAIFDAGLDDRIVELLKLIVFGSFLQGHPDSDIPEVYFFSNDGKNMIGIEVNGEPNGIVEVTTELYENLEKDFAPKLTDIREDVPIIDLNWAMKTMREESMN